MIIQQCVVRCQLTAIFFAVAYTAQTDKWNSVTNAAANSSFDSRAVYKNIKASSTLETSTVLENDPSSDIQLTNNSRRSYRFESFRQNLPVSNRQVPNPWVRTDNSQPRDVESSSQSSNRTAEPLFRDKEPSLNFGQTSTPDKDVWKSDINVDVNSFYDSKASDTNSADRKAVLTSSVKNTTSEINSPVETNHSQVPENQGYIIWTSGNGDGSSGWRLENIGGVARWTTVNGNGAENSDVGTKSFVSPDQYADRSTPAREDTSNIVQPESFKWKDDVNDTIFVDKDGNLLKSWRVVGDGGQDGWQVVDSNGDVEWNIVYENGEWKVVSTHEYNPITWLVPKEIDPSVIEDLESGNETVDYPYTKWDDGQTEYYVYQAEDNPNYYDYPWEEGNRNWQYPENQNFYYKKEWTTNGGGTTGQFRVPSTGTNNTKTDTEQEKKYEKNGTVNGSSITDIEKPDTLQKSEVPPSLQRKSDSPYKSWGTQNYGLKTADVQKQEDPKTPKGYSADGSKQTNVVYNVAIPIQETAKKPKAYGADGSKQTNVVYNVAIPIQETATETGYAQPQYYSDSDNFRYQEWVNQYDNKGIKPVYYNIYPPGYTKIPAGDNTTQSPQYVQAPINVSRTPESTNTQWPVRGSTEKSDTQPVPSRTVTDSDKVVYGYNRPYPAVYLLNPNSKDTAEGSWTPPVLYGEQVQGYNTNSWKEGNGWKTGYGSQVWVINGLDDLPLNQTGVDDPSKHATEKPRQEDGKVNQNNATAENKPRPQTKIIQFPEKPKDSISGSSYNEKGNQSVISGWVKGYGVKTWTTTDVSKWKGQTKTYGFGIDPQKGVIYGENKTTNNAQNFNKGTPFIKGNKPNNKQNELRPTVAPQKNKVLTGTSINSKEPYGFITTSSREDNVPTADGVNSDRIYDGRTTGSEVFWFINENGVGIPAVWQQENATKRWKNQSRGEKDGSRYESDGIYDGPTTGSEVFWFINENGVGIPAVWQQENATKRWPNQSRGDKDGNRYGSDDNGTRVDDPDCKRKSPKQNGPPQSFISSNKGTNSTKNRIWKVDGGNTDSFSEWRPIIIINSNQQIQAAKAWEKKGPQAAKNTTWGRIDNRPTEAASGGKVGSSAKNPGNRNRPWIPNRAGTSRPGPYIGNRRRDNNPGNTASVTPHGQKVVWKIYGSPPAPWKQSGQKSWNVPPVQSDGENSGGRIDGSGVWTDNNRWTPLQQPNQNEAGNPIEHRPVDRTDSWKSVPEKSNVQGKTWKPYGNSAGWVPLAGPKGSGAPNNRQGTSTTYPDCENVDRKNTGNTDVAKDKPESVIIYDKNYPNYNPPIPAQVIIIAQVPDNAPWKPGSENRNLTTPDKSSSGKPKPLWPPRNNKGGPSSGKSWGSSQWPLPSKSWSNVPPRRSGSWGSLMWTQDRKDSMTNGGRPNPYQSFKKWRRKQREKLSKLLTSPSRTSSTWKRNVKRWLG